MSYTVLDVETSPIPEDGNWPEKVHCIVLCHAGALVSRYSPGLLENAIDELMRSQLIVGHKAASFDVPLLQHFYPKFRQWGGFVFDTLAVSRMVFFATLEDRGRVFREKYPPDERERKLPVALLKSHSLEAWGYRLGIEKKHADVDESFYEEYSPELMERCVSDVHLTNRLYSFLKDTGPMPGWPRSSERSMLYESTVSGILGRMERNGVGFDRDGAVALCAHLAEERERVLRKLRDQAPVWYETHSRKRTARYTKDKPWPIRYEKDAEFSTRIEFNPASPVHRAKLLMEEYGWKPSKKTDAGNWITDEETLRDLPYPVVSDLLKAMTIGKRLGQIAEGKWAWLKCERDGRIHGAVHATGTRTSRGAHFSPNLGQVPRIGSLYGKECRALFRPTQPGWLQVGVDAKGLELRLLGHRLEPFDQGRFIDQVLTGDVHSTWMEITGLLSRDHQKEFTYAFLYGAGAYRLGMIYLKDRWKAGKWSAEGKPWVEIEREAKKHGNRLREKLRAQVEGLDELLAECSRSFRRGYWYALDGRILRHKSEHGALNDVLQSDGAIVMKYAMVGADGILRNLYRHGGWGMMLWVHDEDQYECMPELVEPLSLVVCQAIEEAGKTLGVRCPMEGDVKVGKNWGETH